MKSNRTFKLGSCLILPIEYSIQFDDAQKQSEQPKLIDVLSYLAEQHPRLVSREELIGKVWDNNFYVGEKALTNAVWHLRKSLKGANGKNDVIETIRKVGYRLQVMPVWQEEIEQENSVKNENKTYTEKINNGSAIWQKYLPYVLIAILTLLTFWSFYEQKPDFLQPKMSQITREPGSELFPAPSPDGRYIVYKWISPDQNINLYMQDRQQPQLAPTQLTFDEHLEGHSVWSNDGQFLYFSRKKIAEKSCEIIRLEVVSHQEKQIANCPMDGGYYYLDISPDSKILAYQADSELTDDSGIYFLELNSEDAKPYRFSCSNNCNYKDRDMAFSPDGKKIAITRRFDRFKEHIFLVDLATKKAEQITNSEEDIVGLTWHPNNKRLVFATQRADVRHGFIYNIETKTLQDLNIEGFSYPAIAKSSAELFYQQRKEKYHIASLQLNESIASSSFPVVQSDFNHHFPHYSSITKLFVYVSNESGFYELWSANVSGNNRTQLTHLRLAVSYPRWSHDGSKVAFLAADKNNSGDRIYTFDLKTRNLSVLPSPFKEHNRPTWNYDDSAIISAIYDNEYTDLHQITISDGSVKRLTYDGGRYGIMISPTQMLYTRVTNGLWQKDITSNSQPLNKISGEIFKTRYTWTPINNGIYFRQNAPEHHQISFYDFEQHNLNPLVRLPKHTFGNFGSLTYVKEFDKLLFTGTEYPQSDIKMLEHPLLDSQ